MAIIREVEVLGCLQGMNPYKFEELIGFLLGEMGYSTVVTQGSQDGGVDVEAELKTPTGGNIKYVVQVKRYKEPVGPKELRALVGTKEMKRANGCIFVTTSDYTRAAFEFGQVVGMDLINGNKLAELIFTHNLINTVEEMIGQSIGTTPDAKRVKERINDLYDEQEEIENIKRLSGNKKLAIALEKIEELIESGTDNPEVLFLKACYLIALDLDMDAFDYNYEDTNLEYYGSINSPFYQFVHDYDSGYNYKDFITPSEASRKSIREAKENLEKSIEIDPTYEPAWIMIIDLYSRLSTNKDEVKIKLIDKALVHLPNSPGLLHLKANYLLEKKHDIEEGKKYLKLLLRINPDNYEAKETLDLILEYIARRNRTGCHKCGAKGVPLIDEGRYDGHEKFWKWICPRCQALEKEKSTSTPVKKKKSRQKYYNQSIDQLKEDMLEKQNRENQNFVNVIILLFLFVFIVLMGAAFLGPYISP